ncbi:MAG: hypothetical protein ACTHLE_06240 [Agriterribacter sp.]
MKKHILPLFLLFIISLVIFSCKKQTKISDDLLSQEEINFFNSVPQVDSFIKKVADTIRFQNRTNKFVDKLTKEIGFPLWDKSEVVRPTSLIKNVQVIVPFALPAQKEINSFLVCNIYDSHINFQLVKGASYAGYGFDNKQDSLNAGRIAQILMYFDHKIFGDTLFFVNDPRVLNVATNTANRASLTAPAKVIKITPQPVAPTPIYMIPQQCPNGVDVKYTTVDQQSADPFGQDPCTIWITTSSAPQFPSTVPPGGGGGGGGGGASSGSEWYSKPTCIKVEGGKVYFDVPGCTAIPPITVLTDEVILTNKLPLLTNKERQIWDEIYKEEKEADERLNKDCQGTNRTGNIQWPGTMEHWMIMIDYIVQNPIAGEVEYQIPDGGSSPGNKGYADIVNKVTREIFEIKRNNEDGIKAGKIEVKNYVIKANANCPPLKIGATDGGGITPWREGTNYTRRTIPNPKNATQNIIAELNSAGLIVYDYESRITQPVPIVIPQSALDKLKSLIKKLKEKVDDYETVIATFLRENPELVTYIQAAALIGGGAILIGTILEDIATGGWGVLDDWSSFLLAKRLFEFALKLP